MLQDIINHLMGFSGDQKRSLVVFDLDSTLFDVSKRSEKILHDYGDIIVEVKNPPDIPKDKSSEVMSFAELVNAQLEVRSPIIFSEKSTNEIGQFVLFDKEHAYYYLLKSDELDRNKK